VVVIQPARLELKSIYFRCHYGYEKLDFVKGFQNDRAILIGERKRNVDTSTAWEYWNSTERDVNQKTER
jgi:hypothetical protein